MMKTLKQNKIFWRGFLHAALVFLYCALTAFVLSPTMPRIAGEVSVVAQSIFILALLVLSVAVVGYLIFFEPVKYFIKKEFARARGFIAATLLWLFLFLIVFFIILVLSAPGY